MQFLLQFAGSVLQLLLGFGDLLLLRFERFLLGGEVGFALHQFRGALLKLLLRFDLLVLGLFALSVLPVNIAGVVLLALAAGLFLAEVLTPGIGVFAAGGAISLALAGLLLFEDPARVNPAVFLPTAVLVGAASVVAGRIAWRTRHQPAVSGLDSLTGRPAVVSTSRGDTGTAFVDGAWWTVRATEPLRAGQNVRVTGADGLTLLVEPADPSPPAGAGG
jgi:membrane-bound serine protease (ClpP class)